MGSSADVRLEPPSPGQLHPADCSGTTDQPALITFSVLVLKGQMHFGIGYRGGVPQKILGNICTQMTQPLLPISGLIIIEEGRLEDKLFEKHS